VKKLVFVSPIGLHDDSTVPDEDKGVKGKKFFTALATGPFGQSNDALRDVDAAAAMYSEYMVAH
jgi:hypothetical protein